MASGFYNAAKDSFAVAGINWTGATIKAVLIDSGAYTVNLVTHDFLDDVPSGARIGTPQTLASKTASGGGVLDAADITFPSVTGASVEAILIYKDTGVEATSPLIAYIDGITVTPNGGDIGVAWDNGALKIARL